MKKALFSSIEFPPEKWIHLPEIQYKVNQALAMLLGLMVGFALGIIVMMVMYSSASSLVSRL